MSDQVPIAEKDAGVSMSLSKGHGVEKDTRRLAYVIHEAVCTAYKHEGRNALCERAALAVLTSEFLDDYANAVLLDAAREWPTMTRDMVSRGHVRKWLEERAATVLPPERPLESK